MATTHINKKQFDFREPKWHTRVACASHSIETYCGWKKILKHPSSQKESINRTFIVVGLK